MNDVTQIKVDVTIGLIMNATIGLILRNFLEILVLWQFMFEW